jgi:ribosomal-protein-alanine N-acetyltransferase
VILVRFTDEHAVAVLSWHYEAPYDFYDVASDPDEVDMVWNPVRRDGLRGVLDGGELIGYFNFVRKEDEVHIGLALRPDQTGRGLGKSFVEHGLAYARREWHPEGFRLWVAAFNERAIRTYERVGFSSVRAYCRLEDRVEFIEMERPT